MIKIIIAIHYLLDERQGVGDRSKRFDFAQTVSRKHFMTKQDVYNVQAKVKDVLVMRHKSDPTSVSGFVNYIVGRQSLFYRYHYSSLSYKRKNLTQY